MNLGASRCGQKSHVAVSRGDIEVPQRRAEIQLVDQLDGTWSEPVGHVPVLPVRPHCSIDFTQIFMSRHERLISLRG